MDLRGRLDEVLQMSAGEKITEIDEFAMILVLDYEDIRTGGGYIPC